MLRALCIVKISTMATYKKTIEAGFTIVESLVSIIVGAILVGAATLLIVSYTHLTQRSLDLTIANSFAENKIESLRSIGFSGLNNPNTDITNELPVELKSPRDASLKISSVSTDIKKVDLSLTYNDQGSPRTYTYATYIGELGVGQY